MKNAVLGFGFVGLLFSAAIVEQYGLVGIVIGLCFAAAIGFDIFLINLEMKRMENEEKIQKMKDETREFLRSLDDKEGLK